MLTSIINGN